MEKPSKSRKKAVNAAVILGMLLLAAGLLLASRFLRSPYENLTGEDIAGQLPQETGSPASPPESAKAAEADAYLFIILNNRVWGIEPLGEERDVTVDQGDGVVNVIHLLPDGYYMASSTCDNQLCVSEGTVTVDNYQRRILGASVLCLPHALQLELVVPSHTPDPSAPDI